MNLKSEDLNHFPLAAAPAAEFKCVDTEKPAGSRVLLTQHPRPSLISGHDWRSTDLSAHAGKKRVTFVFAKNQDFILFRSAVFINFEI